jgi:hypothetical protein
VTNSASTQTTTPNLGVRNDKTTPTVAAFAITWLVFLIYSFCHAPIPAVNEPHYLTKAKHYWDTNWCAGDFFLESANTHLVFYQTVGWLTQFFSLFATAVLARLIGYGLLAYGWNSLATRIVGDRHAGVISSILFLLFASIGNLSGEWVVGGIESKVFAYAFVLIGFSQAFSQRWIFSGASFGLAVAFHPLVGLWNAVAIGLAIVVRLIIPGRSITLEWLRAGLRDRALLVGLVAFVVVASWGIWPALSVIKGSTPRDTFYANFVQVFHRLSHHLDPMMLPLRRYLVYGGLAIVTAVALSWLRWQTAAKWFASVVFASGIIAIVGYFVGLRSRDLTNVELTEIPFFELRMTLLKFYPFRLFDALMPLLASIVATHLILRNWLLMDVSRAKKIAAVLVLFATCLVLSFRVGSNRHLADEYIEDWYDVCQWADKNLPQDVVVMTPKDTWAFKWLAGRPEFVFGKDCPQDAKGVAEWNKRLLFLRKWGARHFNSETGYTRQVCLELANNKFQTMTHIITRRLGPLDLPVLYRNATFTVYEFR